MREILFRAKTKDDGKWIEGFPVRIYDYGGLVWDMHPFNTNFEITQSVDPKTICQFTGLTDKNGKKIFESDIVKNEYEENKYRRFKVFYNEKKLQWEIMNKYGMRGILANVIGKMEVIGNIFDNPDLF